MSFNNENKRLIHFAQAPTEQSHAWRDIDSPTSLYSSLTIDRSRFPDPLLDEQLDCAMDYQFNLSCLKKINIEHSRISLRIQNKNTEHYSFK